MVPKTWPKHVLGKPTAGGSDTGRRRLSGRSWGCPITRHSINKSGHGRETPRSPVDTRRRDGVGESQDERLPSRRIRQRPGTVLCVSRVQAGSRAPRSGSSERLPGSLEVDTRQCGKARMGQDKVDHRWRKCRWRYRSVTCPTHTRRWWYTAHSSIPGIPNARRSNYPQDRQYG